MKFSVLTLFPNIINSYINESIIKKAINNNKINIEVIDIRKFTNLAHNQVDDYQYGGGKGMVLMIEPIIKAIDSVKTKDSLIILLSPQGKTWNQNIVKDFSKKFKHIILICGHYEGFDERLMNFIDIEISTGDYILTGGELSSLILIDSISRIIPNVISTESHQNESFENDLLDYPVYTKPYDYNGLKVPDVLLSGHHKNIKKWRDEQQVINTIKKRPDLIKVENLNQDQLIIYKKWKENKHE